MQLVWHLASEECITKTVNHQTDYHYHITLYIRDTLDTVQYSLCSSSLPTEKTNTPHKDGVGHPNLHCTQDSLAHCRQGHTLNIITRHVYTWITFKCASGGSESEAHWSRSHCFMKLASDAHHTWWWLHNKVQVQFYANTLTVLASMVVQLRSAALETLKRLEEEEEEQKI